MRITILFVALLLSFASFAQDKVIVHLNDGKSVTYKMSDVKYVEVIPDSASVTPSKPGESAVESGGTIASAVDLGLSVKWASHNLGASLSSEVGSRLDVSAVDTPVAEWGSAWRMPTKEEWQELIEKCTWEWVVRDGIGGRLVTGPSGNSIFLPATGVSVDTTTHIVGAVGFYWTSASATEGDVPMTLATYFDSANVFSMDFPAANQFSVRLVSK